MPEEFYKKVEFLCKKISNVEWSGILLYTCEGTINSPESFIITLKDIILMDKGTSGATEYEFNQNGDDFHIDYMEKYPERRSWKIGHIHSHNSMGVFFSNTDISELRDNAPAYNIYVSLIVNNEMKACCKVCYIEEPLIDNFTIQWQAKNEKGETYISRTTEKVRIEKGLVTYDTEIELQFDPDNFNDFFLENIQKVLQKSEKKVSSYSAPYTHHDIGFYDSNKSVVHDDKKIPQQLSEEAAKILKSATPCLTDYPTTRDYHTFIKLLLKVSFPWTPIDGEELEEFLHNFHSFRWAGNFIERRLQENITAVIEDFFPLAETGWQRGLKASRAVKELESYSKSNKSVKSIINVLKKFC